MRPVDVPGLPGVVAWASFSALAQLQKALEVRSGGDMLAAMLRGDLRAIEEATPRFLLNSDGSRWQGGVDLVPIPTLELGQLLANALHRRLFGTPLELETGDE